MTIKRLERLSRNLTLIVGEQVVNETVTNFRRGGFFGKKWKPRRPDAPRNEGRGILIDSGRLFRSIRILTRTLKTVVVGSTVPYAAVHNQGLKVRKRPARKGRSKRRGGASFKMPKRQFIGESKTLSKRLNKLMRDEIKKAFK
jgi:phage gpG-like protein